MRHLSDGALRRLHDEPLAISAADKQHYEGCPRCQGRYQLIATSLGGISTGEFTISVTEK